MSDRPIVFSICSANYMPLARTLHRSLMDADPEVRFVLFLADEIPAELEEGDLPFEVVEARALGIPDFPDMAFRYTIMELNTAIKPFCFQWLFEREPLSRLVYLDPDILVFRRMSELDAAFEDGAELVLTPHALDPLDDGYEPDDRRIMQTGAFNLGFAAMVQSEETGVLLDWWADHMRTRCLSDLPAGLFVDQKFMDMAPAFVSATKILRHRGYNAAYWNLHERPVTRGPDGWYAGGDQLVFFHFSGVDRNDPEVFSRHQNRFSASMIGQARQLLDQYTAKTAEHDDASAWRSAPYAYGKHREGQPILEVMRRVYRRVHPVPQEAGFATIFHYDPAFYAQPSDDLAGEDKPQPINRVMHETWRMRSDLQAVFDLATADGRAAFADWFVRDGAEQTGLPPELIPAAHAPRRAGPRRMEAPPVDRSLPRAVRMVGYFEAESGLGEAVRATAEAFRLGDIDVRRRVIRAPGFANLEPSAGTVDGPARFLYLHVNADRTLETLSALGDAEKRGAYRIGFWAWELPTFPEAWLPAIDAMHEIWVPSEFVANSVRQRTEKPVTVMPHPVRAGTGDRGAGRAALGLGAEDDVTVITALFDTRSYIRRKNPTGALKAFAAAFPRGRREHVRLVLKSHGPLEDAQARRLFVAAAEEPGVIVRHEVFDRPRMDDLVAATDILLSLHRAEGFGLNIAQAMAAGKPAIATGWSGNADFMTDANSVPIRSSLRPLAPGDYPFGRGQHWAEPDLDHAVEALRLLVGDPGLRMRLGRQAAADTRAALCPERIGRMAAARIDAA